MTDRRLESWWVLSKHCNLCFPTTQRKGCSDINRRKNNDSSETWIWNMCLILLCVCGRSICSQIINYLRVMESLSLSMIRRVKTFLHLQIVLSNKPAPWVGSVGFPWRLSGQENHGRTPKLKQRFIDNCVSIHDKSIPCCFEKLMSTTLSPTWCLVHFLGQCLWSR